MKIELKHLKMSFEIVKITNNNRTSGKTQTRNGILFHIKMTSDTNEVKYAEYGLEKILRSSVTLRCAKNRETKNTAKCSARLSATHKMDTIEIKMSGKRSNHITFTFVHVSFQKSSFQS